MTVVCQCSLYILNMSCLGVSTVPAFFDSREIGTQKNVWRIPGTWNARAFASGRTLIDPLCCVSAPTVALYKTTAGF
jgi:hypothetical protein